MTKELVPTYSASGANRYQAEITDWTQRYGRAQQDLLSWRPRLQSADDDHGIDFDLNKARARELAWQDPYGVNALRIQRDNIIGKSYSLSLDIDARALGISDQAAHEWERLAEHEWYRYAEGPWFGADAARKSTFTFLMHQAMASLHMDGEMLAIVAAKQGWEGYLTCMHLLEPERLVQPVNITPADGLQIISGVERDRMGEPLAYYIQRTYPTQQRALWNMKGSTDYTRVPRMTEWGRPLVLHMMDEHRPGMARGVSQMVSVLKQMKMLGQWSDTELERAIMRASFAAVIESELNYEEAMRVIGAEGSGGWGNGLTAATLEHLKNIAPYYQALGLRFNGSRIAHLLPGEKLNVIQSSIPGAEYDKFEGAMIRQLAAGMGVAAESLSRDFTDTSYSAARMSLADVWRHFLVRREMVNSKFAMPYVGCWLEEAILSGLVPMPDGSDPTLENWIKRRHFIVRGTFISWGKPLIDPVKERQGQQMALAMGLTTLEEEAATEGKAWDDILRQRKQEADERARLELNVHNVDPTLSLPGSTPTSDPDATPKKPSSGSGGGTAE